MRQIVCIVLLLSGCLWAGSSQAATWTDAVKREVELPAAPQRIVSLAPGVTETLFALGLEQQIVGVTRFCDYPEAARHKPQVGDYTDPNLEAILLQRPDLVILSADAATPALLAKMENLGLTVYVVYPNDLKATLQMLRALGQITGKAQAGESLAKELTDALARVQTAVKGHKPPKVLFCVMVQPLVVAGPATMVGDLIKAAGGDNVVPDGLTRYPTWNYEALLVADPDLIIVSPHPGTPNPVDLFASWTELAAVRNRRIISVEPDWVHRPGPRLPLGLTSLAEAFHNLKLPTNTPQMAR